MSADCRTSSLEGSWRWNRLPRWHAHFVGTLAWWSLLGALAGVAGRLAAQTPNVLRPLNPTTDTLAATTIRAVDVAKYLAVLTADSMRGSTPSPALDRAARYVAAQFEALGLLLPGPEAANQLRGWFDERGYAKGIQRYPVPGQFRVDNAKSTLSLYTTRHIGDETVLEETGRDVEVHTANLDFVSAARMLDTAVQQITMQAAFYRAFGPSEAAFLVAGSHSLASLPPAPAACSIDSRTFDSG